MKARVTPIKPAIGATVEVDRADLCDPEVVETVREALERHSVLVFPRIGVSDAEQLAFTDALGPRMQFGTPAPGTDTQMPDVYKVSFEEALGGRKEYVQGTFFWHIDGVMMDRPPSKATLLSARQLSATGGETEFASLYAAYEALPEAEKQEIEGLRVFHSIEPSMKLIFDDPTPEQTALWRGDSRCLRPIVWTHDSGRKSLVIGYSADRVEGMPPADGRALLLRLIEWAAQPAFRYTHKWQDGDLVLWDNTGVMHRVRPYDETSGRKMHRTSIAGTEMVV